FIYWCSVPVVYRRLFVVVCFVLRGPVQMQCSRCYTECAFADQREQYAPPPHQENPGRGRSATRCPDSFATSLPAIKWHPGPGGWWAHPVAVSLRGTSALGRGLSASASHRKNC